MAKQPPPPICILRGHESSITALHFTSEESDGIKCKPSLISGSETGEILIWNLKTCRSYHQFKSHKGKMILYLYYCNSSLLSHGRDGFIHVWKFEVDKWAIINTFECLSYGFCASKFLESEHNTFLIAPTGEGSSMTFYDYKTSKIIYDYSLNASGSNIATCMCIKVFEKDNNIYFLIGYDGGYISLWNYKFKQEKSRLQCHPEVVICLDFDSKFKNRGISGSVDNVLKVWSISENEELEEIHQVNITNSGVNAVKIRDDGKIVITAGHDNSVRVFSWKNMKLLAVLEFHTLPVMSLEYYMDSFGSYKSIFASGSKDKNICLWSVY